MTGPDEAHPPAGWFARQDESADESFYSDPRFVTHIDAATIEALTRFYAEFIKAGSDVLDLMSSWISHLPTDMSLGRVAGLGMNEAELAANPQLTDFHVHNLNDNPELPYPAASFDRITIAVSIQYLTRPVEVMTSAFAALRPGGAISIAMSHRLFPTKAIMAFQRLQPQDRIGLVTWYLNEAGFDAVDFLDRSPPGADPLWIVTGRRSHADARDAGTAAP